MNRPPISGRQKQVLDFLKESIAENGYAPSVRDICKGVSLASTSSVANQLRHLESKGYISRPNNLARAIKVIE